LTPRLIGLLLLPPLLWAGNAIVGRLVAGNVPPLAFNALRWCVALLLLLPLGWRVLASASAREQILARWRTLSVLGLLGVGAYNALQYMALTTSSAMNVTLIASSMPVWMLAIGAIFYRERPTAQSLLGAVLSLAGVAVVLGRGDLAVLAQVRFVVGDLLMIVAIIGWATYSWLLARPHPSMRGDARPNWSWAEFLLIQMMFGLVFAGAAAGAEVLVVGEPIKWSGWVLLALLYVAVGPAIIAYRSWGLGVAQAGPEIAAFFSNLTPLFAAVLSAAVLGEAPQLYHGVAFALIVGGIVVSARRKS
ncbi:MAG: DMT family transporter, partial [Quisquiliibacterium sp.]